MSEILLPFEAYKPELPGDAHALSYGGGNTTSVLDTGHSGSAAVPSSDTAQFPGGLRIEPSSQMDSIQAQGLAREQFVALMASTSLSQGAGAIPAGTNPDTASITPPGTAVASLPGISLSDGAENTTPIDAATGLPKMQFISNDNAMLTSSARDGSGVENDSVKSPEAVPNTPQSAPSGTRLFSLRSYSTSVSAYDYASSDSFKSGSMGTWSWSGSQGINMTAPGIGWPPKYTAQVGHDDFINNGHALARNALGYDLTDKQVNDYADVIKGKILRNGNGINREIFDQLYKMTADLGAVKQRDIICADLTGSGMNQTQAKTLAEDLAAGRKTFDGWRRELAYSAAARQRVSDIFQQQHGFPPTQQDLDYASGRLGSGWSLQDYRRNEALSERTAAQLRDLIPAVQGRSYLESDAGC